MIRHLATLVALTTLLSSGLATLLDHEHGAGAALAEVPCVVDHQAGHQSVASQGRPVTQKAGDRHSHPCVACHSSRVRATAVASPDLVASGRQCFSLERASDEGCGAPELLASLAPRGPPLS